MDRPSERISLDLFVVKFIFRNLLLSIIYLQGSPQPPLLRHISSFVGDKIDIGFICFGIGPPFSKMPPPPDGFFFCETSACLTCCFFTGIPKFGFGGTQAVGFIRVYLDYIYLTYYIIYIILGILIICMRIQFYIFNIKLMPWFFLCRYLRYILREQLYHHYQSVSFWALV